VASESERSRGGREQIIPHPHLPVGALPRQQQRRGDAVRRRGQRREPHEGQDAQTSQHEAQEPAGEESWHGLGRRRRRRRRRRRKQVSPPVLRRAPFSSSFVERGGRSWPRGGEVAAVGGGSPHGRARGGRHFAFEDVFTPTLKRRRRVPPRPSLFSFQKICEAAFSRGVEREAAALREGDLSTCQGLLSRRPSACAAVSRRAPWR